jgi:hypothetical protein
VERFAAVRGQLRVNVSGLRRQKSSYRCAIHEALTFNRTAAAQNNRPNRTIANQDVRKRSFKPESSFEPWKINKLGISPPGRCDWLGGKRRRAAIRFFVQFSFHRTNLHKRGLRDLGTPKLTNVQFPAAI